MAFACRASESRTDAFKFKFILELVLAQLPSRMHLSDL
jgi:hypothetical protein